MGGGGSRARGGGQVKWDQKKNAPPEIQNGTGRKEKGEKGKKNALGTNASPISPMIVTFFDLGLGFTISRGRIVDWLSVICQALIFRPQDFDGQLWARARRQLRYS
jgi:hypothetical protein